LLITGSISGTLPYGSINVFQTFPDDTIFGVSNPANVPFGLIDYKSLNPWSRNWIYEFTLALAKELLGLIRSKFKNFPIPSGELQLNGEELIEQAREDKSNLLNGDGGIRELLDGLTFANLAEQQATLAESLQKQMNYLPMPPSWIIKMG
jgi:hypothetical protein